MTDLKVLIKAVFTGVFEKEYELQGHKYRFRIVNDLDNLRVKDYTLDLADPSKNLDLVVEFFELVKKALIEKDGVVIESDFLDSIDPNFFVGLFELYKKLLEEYDKACKDLKEVSNNLYFYKRWRVINALGLNLNDEKVGQFTDIQWEWMYLNIIEDEKINRLNDFNNFLMVCYYAQPSAKDSLDLLRKDFYDRIEGKKKKIPVRQTLISEEMVMKILGEIEKGTKGSVPEV